MSKRVRARHGTERPLPDLWYQGSLLEEATEPLDGRRLDELSVGYRRVLPEDIDIYEEEDAA